MTRLQLRRRRRGRGRGWERGQQRRQGRRAWRVLELWILSRLVNRGFGVPIPGRSVIRSHDQYDQRSGIFFLFLGERAESKGRSEDDCFSYSLFRCYASRMCFGDGCVINSSAICRLFRSWASTKIADWSARERNPCSITDHPVDDAPRHCCSSPPAVSLARIVPLDALSNMRIRIHSYSLPLTALGKIGAGVYV